MQTIDTEISQRKFLAEIAAFNNVAVSQRTRGIFLLYAEFPNLILAFAAHKLKPAPLVFSVKINFENFDLYPPSVRFVDPFSWENVTTAPTQLLRRIPSVAGQLNYQELVQKDETGLPFICIPGIREYHDHPAHTGDHWLLHRTTGEGSLGFIVEKLYEYGISSATTFQVPIQIVAKLPSIQIALDENLIPT